MTFQKRVSAVRLFITTPFGIYIHPPLHTIALDARLTFYSYSRDGVHKTIAIILKSHPPEYSKAYIAHDQDQINTATLGSCVIVASVVCIHIIAVSTFN